MKEQIQLLKDIVLYPLQHSHLLNNESGTVCAVYLRPGITVDWDIFVVKNFSSGGMKNKIFSTWRVSMHN